MTCSGFGRLRDSASHIWMGGPSAAALQASTVDRFSPAVVDADPPVNRGRLREQGRNRQAPVRSTGVLSTACREGGLGNWGRSGNGGGCASNVVVRMMAKPGSRRGSQYR